MEKNQSSKKKENINFIYNEYKDLREARRRSGNIIDYSLLIISIVLLILGIVNKNIPLNVVVAVLLLTTLIYRYYRLNHVSKQLKAKILHELVKDAYDEVTYNPNLGLDLSIVRSSTMVKNSANYLSKDLISGIYKNRKFDICDLSLEEGHKYTDSYGKGRTMYSPYYKGSFIRFELLKNTNLIIKFYQKAEEDYFIPKDEGLKVVETQFLDFNKSFKVVTNNELLAQKVFTKELKDILLSYDKQYKGRISFGLVNNVIYVLINHLDCNNIRPNKPFNEVQLKEIISLVNLPKNIFKDLSLGTNKFDIEIFTEE